MKFANIITILRLMLVPLIALLIYSKNPFYILLSIILFVLATISDWLDGFIARATKTMSNFGTFFDPIVDKIMILTIFFIFADLKLIPLWIPILLLFRELLVSYIRQYSSTDSKIVGANWMGKSKFIMQTLIILYTQIYLYLYYSGTSIYFFNRITIFYSSLIVAVISLVYLGNFIYWHRTRILKDV